MTAVLSLAVVAAFVGVWFALAEQVVAWSDEITHLSAAKGLLLTGRPYLVAFDRCAALTPFQYFRGLEITWLAAQSYRLFGESLRAARSTPLLFTVLAWLAYAIYARVRAGASGKHIAVAALLFFGQSLVLEQALNVRMYAPMLLLLVLSFVAIWEASRQWQRGRRTRALGWAAAAAVLVGVPTLRGWHPLPAAIVALGLTVLAVAKWPETVAPLAAVGRAVSGLPPRWRYPLLGVLLYALFAVSVVSTLALDFLAGRLLGTQRLHATLVWDNAFGLLRFVLVTNVLIVVVFRWLRSRRPALGFDEWLLVTGVGSGLLVGLFMTHVYVFYSRYFYLSVGLAVLGASRPLAALARRPAAILIVTYLALNVLASVVILKLDRGDIREAIAWLRPRMTADDVVFTFSADLYLNGGRDFCPQSIPVVADRNADKTSREGRGFYWMRRDPARDPFLTRQELGEVLRSHPRGRVYFLYTDFYQFRDRLYAMTVGKPRAGGTNVLTLLMHGDVGVSLLPGLRGGGVRELDRAKLATTLAGWVER